MRTSIRKLAYALGAAVFALLAGVGVSQMGSSAEPLKLLCCRRARMSSARVETAVPTAPPQCSGNFSRRLPHQRRQSELSQRRPGRRSSCSATSTPLPGTSSSWLTQMTSDPPNKRQSGDAAFSCKWRPGTICSNPSQTPAPTAYPGFRLDGTLAGAPLDQGPGGRRRSPAGRQGRDT